MNNIVISSHFETEKTHRYLLEPREWLWRQEGKQDEGRLVGACDGIHEEDSVQCLPYKKKQNQLGEETCYVYVV